jgi:hypothetical protein
MEAANESWRTRHGHFSLALAECQNWPVVVEIGRPEAKLAEANFAK